MQNHAFIKKNSQNGQFATLVVENQVISSFGKGVALAVAVLALAFACLCFMPQQAHAKSYEMPHTTINATVQPNGDLHVVEQRTFDFSGAFTAVWWNFDSLPSGSDIKINSVSMGSSAKSLSEFPSVPFQLDWRESGGPGGDAYSFDKPKSTVYVFFSVEDEVDVVQLDYTCLLYTSPSPRD